MIRGLCLLLLCAGLVHAQEKDDEGMTIDEPPPPEEPGGAPERTTAYPAREPGKKVATVVIRKKVYSFALPADWVLIESTDAEAELSWDVLLPGSTKRGSLILARNDNFGDTRCSPYYQAKWLREGSADAKTEVRTKPCPRLVSYRFLHDTDWIDLFLWVSVRNNLYVFRLACAATDFPQAEADMLGAVRSFTAEVGLWPAVPKGYNVSEHGIWLVACAPDVTASITPLVKALKEEEQRFKRDHGPLPKSDAPLVILVHASKAAAGKVDSRAAENEWDFTDDPRKRRLFAIPFAKENIEQESRFAHGVRSLLLMARYGDVRPFWIWAGERTVAQAEAYTGKPLPSLDEGFCNWASLKLSLRSELEKDRPADADSQTWVRECFFYVIALREGKYRKQYRAFLDEFAETGDGLGALERHVGTIDQEELRASANQYMTRLKEEKRKER